MPLYQGKVEIVLGPRNNKVYVRPLDSGTPYGADNAEECCTRMLEIADEQAAQPDIYAKNSGLVVKEGFTPDQLREWIAATPGVAFKITFSEYGPHMCVFPPDEKYVGNSKVTVF
jgi:hypothetical protein|tara:strand:+ start:115 stop:459 length:345 start_codon:yes stop_codon:yes gene_type:complete